VKRNERVQRKLQKTSKKKKGVQGAASGEVKLKKNAKNCATAGWMQKIKPGHPTSNEEAERKEKDGEKTRVSQRKWDRIYKQRKKAPRLKL